jgi:hypothetical protein
MQTRALLITVIACVLLLQVFGPRVRSMAHDHRRVSESGLSDYELKKRNENAFARILGEFRTSTADIMFMKTELYLHGGMAWIPHLDSSKMMSAGAVEDDARVQVNSLIPPKEYDFRGFIGDLERAVKSFDLGHTHERKDELLPWYRLMTTMDPHYMRGYRLGALWLIESPEHKRWDEALNFINEGLALNDGHPEEYRLHVTKALYYIKRNQFRDRLNFQEPTEELISEALKSAQRAYELGLAERPPEGKIGEFGRRVLWQTDLEEDFLFGARYVPLMLRELGLDAEALRMVREIRQHAPTDSPLRNLEQQLLATVPPTPDS